MNLIIDEKRIRDQYGRQRIFRGENLCFKRWLGKQRSEKYLKNHLEYMRAAGTSIVRLGVTWGILEPKENQYNYDVIEVLHKFVKDCEALGIAVMLDMHQDLYSRRLFGDGMPGWAVEPDIKPQRFLAIWAEGYFYMDSVQRAFLDFWTNKNGVQDKFVNMWKWYRSQFDDCENIIGNDYLNEPYIHENGRTVFLTVIKRLIKDSYNIDIQPEKYFENVRDRQGFLRLSRELATIIVQNGGPIDLLEQNDDYERFGKIIEGLEKYTEDFNKTYYQPFIHRLHSEATGDEFTFFEHNYFSNMGIPFEIETQKGFVYSPHAYDLFVDSPLYDKYSSNERVKYITDKIRENQDKMNVPVIFGEWGCGANSGSQWIDHIEYVMDIMEQNQWSNIYWSYRHTNKEFTRRINRPYPMAICGDIIEYHTDTKNRSFTLTFQQRDGFENIDNEIYIPNKGIYRFSAKAGKHKITIKY